MALIVEDGTGLATAESYASVAYADAYFLARGNTMWAALTTTQKEQDLRAATDYLGQRYGLKWKGSRLTTFQALDWPRWNVRRPDISPFFIIEPNVIPEEVKKACCELAVRASAAPLLVDSGPQVLKEAVGPLSTEYAPGARQNTLYGAAEGLLGPFLGASGTIPIVRA